MSNKLKVMFSTHGLVEGDFGYVLDENGFPIKFCYYNQIDKQGGWFVKEDEEHNIHICSYDTVRTIL